MSAVDRLFDLLPAVHREQDAEAGDALRALLRIVTEQVDVVEGDVAQLYDDLFIETCRPWVVPYIGARPCSSSARCPSARVSLSAGRCAPIRKATKPTPSAAK